DDLFDALHGASNRIRTVHSRHEQGAAYMALGAALATGKPQAYSVVPGPGLALIGEIPYGAIGKKLGQLHEIRDQAGILSRLVDFAAHIHRPDQAGAL